jgi:hypothetical protein
MCVCVCECVCECVYACMHVCMYERMYACMYVSSRSDQRLTLADKISAARTLMAISHSSEAVYSLQRYKVSLCIAS